ncbi:permease [Bacillus sp. CMF12]|uniref:permease n=1 Tax=Bacillaceae TaxID=186817 RepID=UPI001FB2D3CD|nr:MULTISPECIES: permease [Bacillaceae]MDF2040032.1 permease [Cytobacillus oceanisediminis]UOE57485.1 permease [Cytobacillus oceanisediminis]USK51944.1 permease [Bacillus sp. CMF12]
MNRVFRSHIIDITGIILIAILVYFISFSSGLGLSFDIPPSLLNLNVIFISILIEALPFVLIGVLIAGFIQIFITEDHIKRWIPKNRTAAVVMSCVAGALFPACECGIVPIIRRLMSKGVPVYAAIGFMLTGPLINPIVIASTYMAFGNDFEMAGLRMGLGFLIAIIVAFSVSIIFKSGQLKESIHLPHSSEKNRSFLDRIWSMLTHSIDEFFDMAKYLIIGALLASIVQVYMPAKTFLQSADNPVVSLLIMMGFAYVLSLCSEADAFIGASFSSIFPKSSVLGFLIFGPMIDFKNTIMMLSVFRMKFVLGVLALTASVVFFTLLLLQNFI